MLYLVTHVLLFSSIRSRVKDINEAFQELGHMCTLHLAPDKPLTKLGVIQEAVNIIMNLETKVRGMLIKISVL